MPPSRHGIDLKALEAAKEAAAGELKDAQTELDAAKAADATAQTNLQAAQTDASAAQEKVNAANAAVSSAQTAYDEANGKLGDLTSKYNTAKAAYEQAQQTEADKKTEYDRLAEVAKQKKSALENATSDYNKANDEYNTASANVKALEQQISELKANMTVDTDAVKAGLLGFMNHIASSTSFTAAQRANASDAAKLLDGSASKAAWYDDYVNLDASDADNAFSLVNLQNTLTYMNAVNGIRRANGLSDMKVSIVSMAQSALDVCYSSNVWDHAGNSGEGFYMSYNENLAGRAGAYKGSDNPKDWEISFDNGDKYGDDWPFIGWYTAEKRDYDRGDYSNTGHYENFIDSGANSFGFAVGYGKDGNRSTPEDDGAPSPVSIYQGNWAEGDFTVDEFKNLVNTYVDSVYHAGGTAAQKAQLAQLQDQLAAARKALDVKNDALGSAESSLDAAKSAANEANGNVAAAKSDYEAAQEATAIAKAAYGAADVNLKNVDIETPRANLNAAKDEATVAQAALDDANSKLTECQTNASKASARKAKAQGDYDTAKTKSDKANEAYDNATASVKDLTAKRDAANANLASKQGALDGAKKADDAAQAGVDKAQAAGAHAATALSDAKQAVAAKTQAVSDAQAKVKAAEGELARANKAFERFARRPRRRSMTPRPPMMPPLPVSPMPKSSSRPPTRPLSMRTSISSRPRPSLPATRRSRPILRPSTTRLPCHGHDGQR